MTGASEATIGVFLFLAYDSMMRAPGASLIWVTSQETRPRAPCPAVLQRRPTRVASRPQISFHGQVPCGLRDAKGRIQHPSRGEMSGEIGLPGFGVLLAHAATRLRHPHRSQTPA